MFLCKQWKFASKQLGLCSLEMRCKVTLPIDEAIVQKMMLESLRRNLTQLSQDEFELINALFYKGFSEREWSEISGIPQKTINDRKKRILKKLKKLLEK